MEQVKKETAAYSKDSFQCLKGYLALCVLTHHLYQFTGFLSDTSFGYAFLLLGHWAVVVFMFMSGFGLFSSYLSKGTSYIKSFPRARLLPFYAVYLFFVFIYTCFEIFNGKKITLSEILHSLTYGGTIVSFGWYLQLTILMYLFFYILKILFKNEKAFICALFLSIFIFMAVNFVISSQKNVYEPAFSFAIGVLFAYLNHLKPVLFAKRTVFYILVGGASFIGLTLIGTLMVYRCTDLMNSNALIDLLYLILMMLTDLALIVFVLSFAVVASNAFPKFIINPVSSFLGTYSLEIYALQGLVLRFLINKISNRAIYVAVAVLCIIVLSVPVHKLLSQLKKTVSGR